MKIEKVRSLNVMVKPSSCNCNLRCSYCFYFDEADHREIYNYGNMNYEVLENMVKNIFETVEYQVNFVFQGGEPLMRGISFYRKFHELILKYNKNNINITFAIQTNGTLLNDKWFELFEEHNYLVGVSIDGTRDVHDIFRIDIKEKGTFDSILNNINKMKLRKIDFNILTVVNKKVAENVEKIYNFYKQNNFRYIQFIPCLDSLSVKEEDFTLSSKLYGEFLDKLFNLWYNDFLNGDVYSIRYFENLLMILLGRNPESCDMMGHCSVNLVVESNGNAYPCDFYALDEYKIGNINEDKIVDILFSKKAFEFVKKSYFMPEKCKKCKFLKICRTGCQRHKDISNNNKFCYSYTYFLERNLEKLYNILEILQRR